MNPKVRPGYVAYYRVSTAQQGQSGLGIEAQREAVKRFLGNDLPRVEFTETESGRKVKRVELDKALAACRALRTTLIIAKLDRLARNQQFLMQVVDSGVDVRFCDLPEIPAGATGRFMLQQMAAVAELEAGLISERTKAALAAKVARDGQWDRKAKHHLIPGAGQKAATAARKERAAQMASDLAPIIATLRAEGAVSLRQLAAGLDAKAVPTARSAQSWTAAAVRSLLGKIQGAICDPGHHRS